MPAGPGVRAMRRAAACGLLVSVAFTGCLRLAGPGSPVGAGLNTRDLLDPLAQQEAERLSGTDERLRKAEVLREAFRPAVPPPKRAVLCLSGGGSYGAFSAGVLCGWTKRGDRPQFDVVTGISTGALIAPFAFLGADMDPALKAFYTTIRNDDLFSLDAVRGLFSEAFADTTPLARKVDEVVTPDLLRRVAAEHAKGRRLYVGTTELEGRRFVVWDIGAIAQGGTPADRELVVKALLGSSAIPGFFPPARIPVTVDGKPYVERHTDGGASAAIFFRPPFAPGAEGPAAAGALYGSDVYAVVAGKLYADAAEVKPRSLSVIGSSVSTVLYAQTRGDLTRIWTMCQLSGMNYHMTAIPADYEKLGKSTEFKPVEMMRLFNAGEAEMRKPGVWRATPPGVELGEASLARAGTTLTFAPRGPQVPPKPAEVGGGLSTPEGRPVGPSAVGK